MSGTEGTAASPASGAPSALERRQGLLYALAVAAGAAAGLAWPAVRSPAEVLLWPVLAALIFATVTQTPLGGVPAALRSRRWIITAVVSNFLVVPAVVVSLVSLVEPTARLLVGASGQVDALRVGLLLVLLVPCTDWFLTFVHLAEGDRAAAAAITPVNLLLQLVALPLWLWAFVDVDVPLLSVPVVAAAAGVVLVPFALAVLVERSLARSPQAAVRRQRLGRLPIPLLAAVMALVAAAHADAVREASGVLWVGVVVCAAYLLLVVVLGLVVGDVAGLGPARTRTLVCTLGTRNSFVVLPLALALPAGWELAAAVVVAQALVELTGMSVVSRVLARGRRAREERSGGRRRPGAVLSAAARRTVPRTGRRRRGTSPSR